METHEIRPPHYFKNMPHHWRKLFQCCLGFASLEWLIIQIFRDYIGYSNLEAWIIGVGIFLVYFWAAIRYPQDFIDPMFS
ncbi:MAG TPA: hypothetical protein VK808_04645 [Bacteroidia bacterium]|nr:hypothetical protein [Bacteroidia bacterium]